MDERVSDSARGEEKWPSWTAMQDLRLIHLVQYNDRCHLSFKYVYVHM